MKPTKNDPQEIGSSLTYNRRYMLAAILGIAQQDDDGNAASVAQQINPEPVDQTKVKAAYDAFKKVIDADAEVMDHKRVQEGYARLTNDERLGVDTMFGKQKIDEGKGILYRSVIKNLLNVVGE
mgnify:CR=1 FL=1